MAASPIEAEQRWKRVRTADFEQDQEAGEEAE
jgi:hypothetical protein